MTCSACRHGWCWLCMGDDTNHEWPRGYGHAIQCDSMEDVKKKGRMAFVYDEHAAAAKMERELKTVEKHSNRYKYQRDQEKKHAQLKQKIKSKIDSFIRNSNSLTQDQFEFLLDSI